MRILLPTKGGIVLSMYQIKKKNEAYSKWNSKSETVLILFSVSLHKNKAMGINNMGKWQRHLEETKI